MKTTAYGQIATELPSPIASESQPKSAESFSSQSDTSAASVNESAIPNRDPMIFIAIPPGEHSPSEVRAFFEKALAPVLERLHRSGDAPAVIKNALASLGDLIDRAASDPEVNGIELRLTSIVHSFSDQGGSGYGTGGSVSSMSIEVGLSRTDGNSLAEETRVLDLSGSRVALDLEQRQDGQKRGAYLTRSGGMADKGKTSNDEWNTIRASLARMQMITEELKAYRNGNEASLDRLIRAF